MYLAERHNKQFCRIVLHTIPFVRSTEQGSCECLFLSFSVRLNNGSEPRSTDCEANALITISLCLESGFDVR